MFERFTDAARRVVVSSQEEARELLHDYIGTEHLLLGMWHARAGDPVLAAVLPALALNSVREHVTKLAPRGFSTPAPHIPFRPEAKAVMEQALRECMDSGQYNIHASHLLLGMLKDPDSPGVRVLVDLGIDPDQLWETVTAAWRGEQPPPADRIAVLEEQVRQLTRQVDELRRRLDPPQQRNEG